MLTEIPLSIVLGLLAAWVLLALATGALAYLARPKSRRVMFRDCFIVMLLALAVSAIAFVLLRRIAPFAEYNLSRSLCLVVLLGYDFVAAIIVFSALSFLATGLLFSLEWRKGILRAWAISLLVNAAMCIVMAATVIILLAPAPFLAIFLPPQERAARILVCNPPPLNVAHGVK